MEFNIISTTNWSTRLFMSSPRNDGSVPARISSGMRAKLVGCRTEAPIISCSFRTSVTKIPSLSNDLCEPPYAQGGKVH